METDLVNEYHVHVRNVSGLAYAIEEIGGYVLGPGEEVDLMDPNLVAGYYCTMDAALHAINELPRTKIYQAVHGMPKVLDYSVVPNEQLSQGEFT
jgi:hypothetical protein